MRGGDELGPQGRVTDQERTDRSKRTRRSKKDRKIKKRTSRSNKDNGISPPVCNIDRKIKLI